MMVMPALFATESCRHCGLPVAHCKSCDTAILWAESMNGKPWPLDAALTTVAYIAVWDPKEPPRMWTSVQGHVPHHITCPQGAQWSRKRKEAERSA